MIVTTEQSVENLADESGGEALHYTLRHCYSVLEALNTPVSLGLALCIRYGDVAELLNHKQVYNCRNIVDVLCSDSSLLYEYSSIDPRHYESVDSFRRDYCAVKLCSKLGGLVREDTLNEVALTKFRLGEESCLSSNIRLNYGALSNNGCEFLLSRVRRKLRSWLGRVPPMTDIIGLGKWGPGATATIKGDRVRPEAKITEAKLSVTPQLLPWARRIVGMDLHWCKARLDVPFEDTDRGMYTEVLGPCTLLQSEFIITDWMRVVTVPKDSKTNRTIGCEPTFNTWFQRGIGRYLSRVLRKLGIDLSDQRKNQQLAAEAISLGLATVDLSAASDSISYWLVKRVLPPAWFRLLEISRSSKAMITQGGKQSLITLEKFSSMGNGFTFELESLLFYAIALCASEDVGETAAHVSVYGDDIIVPARAYPHLCCHLRVLGFSVNPDKTFASGVFYESCGEHYFKGVCVTPIYQKELLYAVPHLVRSYNRVHRWLGRTSVGGVVSSPYLEGCRLHSAGVAIPVKRIDSAFLSVTRSLCKRYRPDQPPPILPYGHEGDAGFWTTSLEAEFVDGRVLLPVIELLANAHDTESYQALLAVSLQRAVATKCDKLAYLREGTSPFLGKVSLRGVIGYHIRRRWVEIRRLPDRQWNIRLTKPLLTKFGLEFIPQLRSTVLLT